MSYYGDEEVTYIGILDVLAGLQQWDFYKTDIKSVTYVTIAEDVEPKYYYKIEFNKGDIICLKDNNFKQGAYFKFKINGYLSYGIKSNLREARQDFATNFTAFLKDVATDEKYSSPYVEYLGADFTLAQLTDEPLTEEAPTELPTSGELFETSYDFSGLTLNVSDEIIEQSISGFPTFLVSIVPLGLAAFFACFGIKKALSYFRTIGRGGH